MGESIGGSVAKLGERFMEGVPGFALVALVVGIALPFALPASPETPTQPRDALTAVKQSLPVLVVVVAWLGYFFGHYLDEVIFDPVWGVRIRTPKAKSALRNVPFFEKLDKSRERLAEEWKRPVTGLFNKAQGLTRKTELWEEKVKWPLEWSKAFRSFVIVGVIALVLQLDLSSIFATFVVSFVLWLGPRGNSWTAFKYLTSGVLLVSFVAAASLHSWTPDVLLRIRRTGVAVTAVTATVLCAACYVGLRLLHMIRLYDECVKIKLEADERMFCAESRVFKVRKVLLYALQPVSEAHFREAAIFIQSEAQLHVSVKTLHPATVEPDLASLTRPHAKEKLKKMCLYESHLKGQDVVVLDKHAHEEQKFEVGRDVVVDVVIEVRMGDAPRETRLNEYNYTRRDLNGRI
jgi:hypothetical protein